MSLADYEGKVLLTDFWATWCLPCRQELPNLKRLLTTYGSAGFAIVGFAEDANLTVLTGYLEKEDIGWETIPCPDGETDRTVSLYRVVNIPTSVLLDRRGVARHVNLTGARLEEAVVELFRE